jgi:hypothetical protein
MARLRELRLAREAEQKPSGTKPTSPEQAIQEIQPFDQKGKFGSNGWPSENLMAVVAKALDTAA